MVLSVTGKHKNSERDVGFRVFSVLCSLIIFWGGEGVLTSGF